MPIVESCAFEEVSDYRCQLGEGPLYDPDLDITWWFDIVENKLLEKRLGEAALIIHELPFMASVIGRARGGKHLVVSENGIYLRDYCTQKLDLLAELEEDNPHTRSNDGRVHACGALWVGTMGKAAEKSAGAIYWFYKGELRQLYSSMTIPNSICFSPDGRTAYFADTAESILYKVEISPKNGVPLDQPQIFYDHRGGRGGMDGSIVDKNGVIWNARWGAGMLDAYTPDAERIKSVSLPFQQVSCPAIYGSGADRLILTSAWQGLYSSTDKMKTREGTTIALDLSIQGNFEHVFETT